MFFYQIWTEARSGIGAVNFITGMGGFLQAVYFGYGGVRIYNEHLSFNPRLPPMTSGFRLLGMNYLGNSLDVVIRHYTVSVTVTNSSQLEPLYLKVQSTQAVYDLQLGEYPWTMSSQLYQVSGHFSPGKWCATVKTVVQENHVKLYDYSDICWRNNYSVKTEEIM